MTEMTDAEYQRLFSMWDGRAQYIDDGGTLYQVLTPNGPERPLFAKRSNEEFYGATSGGALKSADGPKGKAQLGRNPKVSDVSNE